MHRIGILLLLCLMLIGCTVEIRNTKVSETEVSIDEKEDGHKRLFCTVLSNNSAYLYVQGVDDTVYRIRNEDSMNFDVSQEVVVSGMVLDGLVSSDGYACYEIEVDSILEADSRIQELR